MEKCVNCGSCADHLHHVVPKSKGGVGTVPLCSACHSKVHDADLSCKQLTKDALVSSKKQGKLLGMHSPNHEVSAIQGKAVTALKQGAQARAIEVEPLLTKLLSYNLSQRMIASVLSFMCISAPRNGRWSQATVHRMVKRLGL